MVVTTSKVPVPRFYNIRKITPHFGVEGLDIDVSKVDLNDKGFITQLKDDLVQHRAVLFRKQDLSGQFQVDLSNALGTVESTFYKHPRSPHPDIFRVSNTQEEGCTRVGRSGWHIDGTFQMTPFMYQTMHFPSVALGGDTYFMPLKELYDSFSSEEQSNLDKLWMATGRRQAPIHPLVYKHPFRPNEKTMLFHCGKPFVEGWYKDAENSEEIEEGNGNIINQVNVDNLISPGIIQEKLTRKINSIVDDLGIKMEWEKGDFMISDNLGLVHYASEGTQTSSHAVGLRILHRTTIVGGAETVPTKLDGRKSFKTSHSTFF
jgi:taurine dioxygenase